jgi:hypothetical protein
VGAPAIHDWVGAHERFWSDRFDRLDAVLEDLERSRPSPLGAARRTL